ncbi:hypothetical protein TL16_g08155, partial [Triparma laevis f. inornata]
YYKILSLPPSATSSEIRSAYKKLALKYHPDRARTPSEKEAATPRFQKIAEAYEVLGDDGRRRSYD